nr:signal recognition particle-docking protein FtsY [Methylosinus sp. LW4]
MAAAVSPSPKKNRPDRLSETSIQAAPAVTATTPGRSRPAPRVSYRAAIRPLQPRGGETRRWPFVAPWCSNRPRPRGTMSEAEEKKGLFARLFGRGGTPAEEAGADRPKKRSWWERLTGGLSRSSQAIVQGISDLFSKRKLDALTLEELEDVLIRADLGVAAAQRIAGKVGAARYEKDIGPDEVRAILAEEVERVLEPVALPFEMDQTKKPFIVLVVGVNGSGKTTTIAKLAAKWTGEGKKVMLAAGDTFRAAAVEQLRIWGERLNSPVCYAPEGADAAGLAFDAIKSARERDSDILLMDTAGRLQNRAELMAELAKIVRVMKKAEPEAPHAVLLVLDATVGQNAIAQVDAFERTAGVTGLVMTKLDGTARGGILVAIAEKYGLPIHFIGVGEGSEDLEPFTARDFARAIAGLDSDAEAGEQQS